MILYCVRHGESTYNAEGRVQGQSDVPLSERGRRQSEAAAARLADLPIDAIYSSPLRRAFATARAVAEPLGLEIQTDPRLMEVNAGIFQDKLRSDLERLCPEEFARWISGDADFVIPGGESRRVLARRGLEALEAIRRTDHEHVAVVAHGRLLVVTFQALMEFPADVALQNASITRISFDGAARAELLSVNEIDHLNHVGLDREENL